MLVELSKKTYGVVLTSITTVAVIISLLAGRNAIAQSLIMLITTFLLTGNRPTFLYTFIKCLPRDFK